MRTRDQFDPTADGLQVLGYDGYYFDTFPPYVKSKYEPYTGELASVLQADEDTNTADCANQSACGGSS